MKSFDYHAKLLVYELPNLKKPTIKRLAKWLRDQAEQLENSPQEYSKKYTARLMK